MSRRLVAGLVALIAIGGVFAYGLSKQGDVSRHRQQARDRAPCPASRRSAASAISGRTLDSQGVLARAAPRASPSSSTSGARGSPDARRKHPTCARSPTAWGTARRWSGWRSTRRRRMHTPVHPARPAGDIRSSAGAAATSPNRYGVTFFPTTIVVDGRGEVVDRLIGPQKRRSAAGRVARARRLARCRSSLEIALSPVGLSAAFAAGVVSFVSPCVWPLVPAYLSYVSGVSFNELGDQTRRVAMTTAAFVLGFGAVFTALGAGAGAVGDALTEHRWALEIASGLLIVLMGAVLAGFGGMLLQQERRLQPARKPAGPIGAVVAGAGFAHRLDALRGPTLAAILALPAAPGRRSTAPSCWPCTRSAWASRSCSRACSSRAASRASAAAPARVAVRARLRTRAHGARRPARRGPADGAHERSGERLPALV